MSAPSRWSALARPGLRARKAALGLLVAAAGFASTRVARAGDFDYLGNFSPADDAVVFDGFSEVPELYLPEDPGDSCLGSATELVVAPDALEGDSHLLLDWQADCADRYRLTPPAIQDSYRLSLWMRHGALDAALVVVYPADSGRERTTAWLGPTGRTTSDGWVELATNEVPIDGALAEVVYLSVRDHADASGVELDALELVPAGEYVGEVACEGIRDPVCGSGAFCTHNRCRLGRLFVPPLPPVGLRDEVVDAMASQLRIFFGGRKTRLADLPVALATLESIRSATTAWEFWGGWARAIRQLHDWHTSVRPQTSFERRRRLNLCFIEGDGDASALLWPRDPRYLDILVSHTGSEGEGTHGIKQGDRLVAVDGLHPIEWARSLVELDWGSWQACDADVYAEWAERMRGLIISYATDFTVIHCDATTGTCQGPPETLRVADLPEDTGGQVSCDNRPFYHFEEGQNPGPDHGVGYQLWRGRIAATAPEEAIYGMVWDTLYGGGDPNGWLNAALRQAANQWKQSARGVILDHRAGNGGTMDSPSIASELIRPEEVMLVFASPIARAGYDGPANPTEGLELFNRLRSYSGVTAGSADYDPELPVALVLHRDGSASDFMPQLFKGAPKTRLFGPHATAGAFSTFDQFFLAGGINYQFGTGDSITNQGEPLIGHGVEPDFVVIPKQSDLLAGRDTIFEAALAWVRQELKP